MLPVSLIDEARVTFTGTGRLGERPLTPYFNIFNEQGISFSGSGLPLTVEGKLKPGSFIIDGSISSQFVTGLLFALPIMSGDSEITIKGALQSRSYVDISIEVLRQFGINIHNDNHRSFYIKGNQAYVPRSYTVEGDYSQAAFWLAAGAITEGVTCSNLRPNSLQGDRVIIDILRSMGASLKIENNTVTACSSSELFASTIDVADCPDLAPILTVLGCFANGTTRIINAERLRIKESDRLCAIVTELAKLGADISQGESSIVVTGRPSLEGGIVNSWGDHRIAMALSIASVRCKNPVIIEDFEAISKSYPHFYNDFRKLGGKADE